MSDGPYLKPGWTQTWKPARGGVDREMDTHDHYRAVIRTQDPAWVCEHEHPTSEEAYQCALSQVSDLGSGARLTIRLGEGQ